MKVKSADSGNYSVGAIHLYTTDTVHSPNPSGQPRDVSHHKDLYFSLFIV